MTRRLRRSAPGAALSLGAALLLSSCGPPAITRGSVPFPSRQPVMADAQGNPVRGFPAADSDARLVVLDLPWCTPCDGIWEAVERAVDSFPPGTVRVYRLLFDRERIVSSSGPETDVPPAGRPPGTGAVETVTYHVLPAPFAEEFDAERGPLLFLLDRKGKVEGRWSGFHPALADDLAAAIRPLAAPEMTPVPAATPPAPGR